MNKLIYSLILFTSVSLSVGAQSVETDTLAQIEAIFKNCDTHTPGGAVAIKRKDDIIYQKAFGMADLEQGSINTIQTKFEAGSVSKQFTATAILQLVHEGKISLEDDVREFIPELPTYGEPITVRHLLNHTSGLKDWGSIAGLCGWPRTSRVYTQDHARDYIFRQQSLNNEPGEEYLYSNSNYTLLVTIVERVSGKSLQDYTEEVFFEPLGMNDTEWRDDYREVVPGRATAYNKIQGEFKTLMPFENTYGHAALLTTTSDLLKWNDSWLNGRLGEDLNELRLEQGRVANDKEISYAAGVRVVKFNGLTEVNHSGATAGYRAWLAYYPEIELSIVYLSNDASASTTETGRKLIEIFAGEEQASTPRTSIAMEVNRFRDKTGLYKDVNSHRVVTFEVKDDEIIFDNKKLEASAPDTLFNEDMQIYFDGDLLKQSTTTNPITFKKVEEVIPEEVNLNNYAGTYFSVEAACGLEIDLKEGELLSKLTPSRFEKLNPSFKDAFSVHRNKVYTFHRNEAGDLLGLYISVPRAERVYFKKVEN